MNPVNEAVKLVVFVPETHADLVRKAMGDAGAGVVGDYRYCTFSVKGVGRYMPTGSAHPYIGVAGRLEQVVEERVETVCLKKDLQKILTEIKKVHPYEEIAFDVYPFADNLSVLK